MDKFMRTFLLLAVLMGPSFAVAHGGGLDSNGGHYCRTNCEKWGLQSNEYHKHSSNGYTNSKGEEYNKDGELVYSPPSESMEPEPHLDSSGDENIEINSITPTISEEDTESQTTEEEPDEDDESITETEPMGSLGNESPTNISETQPDIDEKDSSGGGLIIFFAILGGLGYLFVRLIKKII